MRLHVHTYILCCKKEQKKVHDQLLVCEIWDPKSLMGPLKVLNGAKMILDDQENHLDPFQISFVSFKVLQRSPISQTSN